MVIRVLRTDGLYDMVQPQVLDRMLREGLVSRFMRSAGWVDVGTDPIRVCSRSNYRGRERRSCYLRQMQA